jgi:hypothetical protein
MSLAGALDAIPRGGIVLVDAKKTSTKYVTAHNWAYIARFGCCPRLSLFVGAALGPGFSRGTAYRPGAWRRSTTSPAILLRLLQHSAPVAGRGRECAAMAGVTVLLECTRTICIGYRLIAGMG